MKQINIMSAIKVLRPNANCIIHGNKYEGIDKWDDGGKDIPSKAEIDTEIIRQEAEYDANQYQRDRQYPSIGDQLDMQYHDQLDGTTTWKDAIAKVKLDNPKE
jgi:hypothetical protein